MSMLSTPTPALPMKDNLLSLDKISEVSLVALRTTMASKSDIAPFINSSSV